MRIEFNYDDVQFVIDPDLHQIYVNGELADGKFAPVGGIVVDVDVEDPEVCKVMLNVEEKPVEKIIVYGAPLKIGDKVICLDQYVIPAELFVENHLQGDYELFSARLKSAAENYIARCAELTAQTEKSASAAAESAASANSAAESAADDLAELKSFISDTVGSVNEVLDKINGEVL